MKPAMIKAVLFDLDGTLVDTAPDFLWAINQLKRERSEPAITLAEMRSAISHGSAGLVTTALGIPAISPEFEPTRQALLREYLSVIGRYALIYEGLHDLLATLAKAGIEWGISTNKPSLYTKALLDTLSFPCQPATVVCPDDVSQPKPSPEPLFLNCRQLGIDPSEAVFVGDHVRDIDAGKAAGMRTIAAAWGYIDTIDEAYDWNADAVCMQSQALHGTLTPWL